jgi:hypothetical protein
VNTEPNPGDIDSAITIWVVLASLLLAVAAYLLYQAGHAAIGVVLGIISFIGVNIPTVGYSWWRRRQRAAKVTNASGDDRAI